MSIFDLYFEMMLWNKARLSEFVQNWQIHILTINLNNKNVSTNIVMCPIVSNYIVIKFFLYFLKYTDYRSVTKIDFPLKNNSIVYLNSNEFTVDICLFTRNTILPTGLYLCTIKAQFIPPWSRHTQARPQSVFRLHCTGGSWLK